MKYQINLLPPQTKKTNKVIDLLHQIGLVLLGLALASLLVWGLLQLANQVMKFKIAKDQSLLDKLQTEIGAHAELERKIIVVNERLKTAGQLAASGTNWQKILEEIINITAGTVKLSNLTMNEQAQAPWEIRGTATNQREMLIFQAKLEQSPIFTNATITDTSNVKVGDSKTLVGFSLKFELQKP